MKVLLFVLMLRIYAEVMRKTHVRITVIAKAPVLMDIVIVSMVILEMTANSPTAKMTVAETVIAMVEYATAI